MGREWRLRVEWARYFPILKYTHPQQYVKHSNGAMENASARAKYSGVSEFELAATPRDIYSSPTAQQPLVGQGLLVIESLDTPHSVGLLWISDRPNAETSI
jgi:hypothetical protein